MKHLPLEIHLDVFACESWSDTLHLHAHNIFMYQPQELVFICGVCAQYKNPAILYLPVYNIK